MRSRAQLSPEAIPPAVRGIVATLRLHGHAAHLVGGCVRDLAGGVPARDFDVATEAPPERVLEIFPRAVPTGLLHGTVMVPTPSGPVDVTTYRAGPRLEDDLAHRDFTLNAVAYDPVGEQLVDPFGGRRDLAAGVLRCVGDAASRLAEDPLRALRAARFVASLPVEADPALESAMSAVPDALATVAPERIRYELEALLLGAHAGRGLRLLQRTGLAQRLAPGTREDAPAVVDALPPELGLRLAGWLRDTAATSVLARLRFPRHTTQRVGKLLGLHPVERQAHPRSEPTLRRLLRRAGPEDLDALLALRDAELAGQGSEADTARASLQALREGMERVRRHERLALHRRDLALDGLGVMKILGCGPGPGIGRALAHLTDRVLEDPSCNTPEILETLVLAWAASESSGDA